MDPSDVVPLMMPLGFGRRSAARAAAWRAKRVGKAVVGGDAVVLPVQVGGECTQLQALISAMDDHINAQLAALEKTIVSKMDTWQQNIESQLAGLVESLEGSSRRTPSEPPPPLEPESGPRSPCSPHSPKPVRKRTWFGWTRMAKRLQLNALTKRTCRWRVTLARGYTRNGGRLPKPDVKWKLFFEWATLTGLHRLNK